MDFMHDYKKRLHGSSLVDHLLSSFDVLQRELDAGKHADQELKEELESLRDAVPMMVRSATETAPARGAGILLDIFVSVGAVLVCAAIVFAVQRKR